MNQLVDDLILDERRNHSLDAYALIQFLILKGIIDVDEFNCYCDAFAKAQVRLHYPDLPDKFFE